jgi:hypothetical protein
MKGSGGIVISTNIPVKKDGMPYSTYRTPEDPGVAVYFNLKGVPHVLACDKWKNIEDNMWAIAKHIEALRGQERWGVGNLEQAFAGFKALPESFASSIPDPWWRILGFSDIEDVTSESSVNEAYKILSKKYHPDIPGGSHEKMQQLNLAKEKALKFLAL